MMIIKNLMLRSARYHIPIKLSLFSYPTKILCETMSCFLKISLIAFQRALLIGVSSWAIMDGCIKNIINKKTRKKHGKCASYVWSDILNEVVRRKTDGQKADLFNTSDNEYEAYYIETRKKLLAKKSSIVRYRLGAKHGNKYFTKREAECMVCLLKGKTIASVAAILKLSPRTVEYYIKNMKVKLACRTKFELIDLVRASEFMKNLDFL
jgi:DNA-binding CsgD family transcriptional regulator